MKMKSFVLLVFLLLVPFSLNFIRGRDKLVTVGRADSSFKKKPNHNLRGNSRDR